MRTTRVVSITLPPPLFEQAQALAKQENRTMSELVREALRYYERKSWWEEMNAYGRAKAGELGLSEADVVPLAKEVRKQHHARQISRRPAK